ncbi:MAG: GNAT family N-acetyltransferase [Pseudomonadota bacterium]
MTLPHLRTERLLLRPLRRSDAEAITGIVETYEVSKWLVPVPHPYTLEDAHTFLELVEAGEEGPVWAVSLDQTLIGVISVEDVLGYYLSMEHWGQGYMTEAAKAVLSWRFSVTDLKEITSGHFVGNEGSRRVLQKVGFQDAGETELFSTARGKAHPSRRMVLTRRALKVQAERGLISYRAMRPDDFEPMCAMVNHWEVVRNLGSWSWPPNPAFVRKRCQPFDGDGFVWAVCKDGVFIGQVAVVRGVLGYMLAPQHHGQGIMGRAVGDALEEAFAVHGVEEVTADIWADNEISRHLLTKFGFELTVEETVHALARNEMTASETYKLTSKRWQTLSEPA